MKKFTKQIKPKSSPRRSWWDNFFHTRNESMTYKRTVHSSKYKVYTHQIHHSIKLVAALDGADEHGARSMPTPLSPRMDEVAAVHMGHCPVKHQLAGLHHGCDECATMLLRRRSSNDWIDRRSVDNRQGLVIIDHLTLAVSASVQQFAVDSRLSLLCTHFR